VKSNIHLIHVTSAGIINEAVSYFLLWCKSNSL